MANIRQLVENKQKLDYPALCKALIHQFGVSEPVSWDSILPAPQQQELFGEEVRKLIKEEAEKLTTSTHQICIGVLREKMTRWTINYRLTEKKIATDN